MSEPITTLGQARFDGVVTVTAVPAQGMITLRGDLSNLHITQVLSDVAGVAMPGVRRAEIAGETGLLWMSPDEAMVLCPYDKAAETLGALTEALASEHVLCADVSDARAVITLEGTGIREVLAKVTPADLRPTALPLGEVRRTRLAQVAGAFWLSAEDQATVVCFRSVAGYVFELLSTAARADAEVGYF